MTTNELVVTCLTCGDSCLLRRQVDTTWVIFHIGCKSPHPNLVYHFPTQRAQLDALPDTTLDKPLS